MLPSSIPIKIYYKHLNSNNVIATEEMNLPLPNGSPGFEYLIEDNGNHLYEDLNKMSRKGTAYKRVRLLLNYSSHKIELNKLLIADKIQFDFSGFVLPFSNIDFKLVSDKIKKNWFASMPITTSGGDSQVPDGSVLLEFISINIYS